MVAQTHRLSSFSNVIMELTSLESESITVTVCRTDNKQNRCGPECEYEKFHFRRGSPLACGVMGSACSSSQ